MAQNRGVGQAAKLAVLRVVLGHVAVPSAADEHLLDANVKRFAELLDGVDRYPTVDFRT